MADAAAEYDPRYLAGVLLFNDRAFFEAHEVWEELWHETTGPDRRFIQGLIQAAVCLFHFGNGNVRGAARLLQSSHNYMRPYLPKHFGLDVEAFWQAMHRCCAALRGGAEPPQNARPDEALVPIITLDPPPTAWPNPDDFLEDEPDDE